MARDEKTQLVRNALIVCETFVRNMTFYRAAWDKEVVTLLSDEHPQAQFWRQVNGNFLDGCTIEWCKLFGDKKAKHHYSKLVSDFLAFEGGMFPSIFGDTSVFDDYVSQMRFHRDKFAAHLDGLTIMQIPKLDLALASIIHLQDRLVTSEVQSGDLAGLADTSAKFKNGIRLLSEQADRIYHRACE